MVNNNVTIHNEYKDKSNEDYSDIEDLINKKYKKLNNNIEDTSDELKDNFNDKIGDLETKVAGLGDNVEGLLSKAKKLENGSIPIKVDIPSQSRQPFVSLNDDDEQEDEDDDSSDLDNDNNLGDDSNAEQVDSDDETDETIDDADDSASKAATKAYMQKLADYIKEVTEKSRPTIPKEAGIAAGAVGIGIILKKYAMILGGRNDVFR